MAGDDEYIDIDGSIFEGVWKYLVFGQLTLHNLPI